MTISGELVSQALSVSSMLIKNYSNESPAIDYQLLNGMRKLFDLLKCSLENVSSCSSTFQEPAGQLEDC